MDGSTCDSQVRPKRHARPRHLGGAARAPWLKQLLQNQGTYTPSWAPSTSGPGYSYSSSTTVVNGRGVAETVNERKPLRHYGPGSFFSRSSQAFRAAQVGASHRLRWRRRRSMAVVFSIATAAFATLMEAQICGSPSIRLPRHHLHGRRHAPSTPTTTYAPSSTPSTYNPSTYGTRSAAAPPPPVRVSAAAQRECQATDEACCFRSEDPKYVGGSAQPAVAGAGCIHS